MNIDKELYARSGSKCELCGAEYELTPYLPPPLTSGTTDEYALVCNTCLEQIEDPQKTDPHHWRCLNDSMWHEGAGVKVIVWRMLNRLRDQGWPRELLDMLHLEEETLAWAKATGEGEPDEDAVVHVDSNGVVLQTGDTVLLIKDLNVKGANFTAKRGTAVRRISVVPDNAEQIEGVVNGQRIVLLTQFVKKSG